MSGTQPDLLHGSPCRRLKPSCGFRYLLGIFFSSSSMSGFISASFFSAISLTSPLVIPSFFISLAIGSFIFIGFLRFTFTCCSLFGVCAGGASAANAVVAPNARPIDTTSRNGTRIAFSLQSAKPVVTLVFPVAAGIHIGHENSRDVLRVLEPELGRHAQLHRKSVRGRQDLVAELEREKRLRMQR